jgi:prepilin-type N-terminal cleavage/methylation domain-containing protein
MRLDIFSKGRIMMRKKGFTLIELLVVIAIIALLLAILMPSLKAAKSKAIQIYSMSNMRSLSVAWNVYGHSNDSKMVGAMVHYDYSKVKDFHWVHPLDTASTNLSDHEKEIEGIRKGALWPYIEIEKAYHSPGSRDWTKITDPYTSGMSPYRSYAISDAMNGSWRPNYRYQKTGGIRNPSSRMIFTEEEDDTNWGSWILGAPGTNSWWDPLAAWYNKGTTSIFGFADGHAEQHVWKDKHTRDWIKDEDGTAAIGRTPPAGELEDIRFMSRAYHHKYLKLSGMQ